MMVDPVRLAVVGVGRMGRVHVRALHSARDVDLVAVADAAESASESVGRAFGVDAIGLSALAERDDIDGWVVATPTSTHVEIVRAGLRAGVHMLCEKPLSLDPLEAVAIGAEARSEARVLQVGFWRRYSPPWRTAYDLITSGAIGRPLFIRLAQWDADPPPADFCDPAVSGGLAVDCGVHEYDLAEWLTGQPVRSVNARNLPIVDDAVMEAGDVDNLVAWLHLESGAVAGVDLSRNCRYGDDVRTEILGEEGAILIDLLPSGRTRLCKASGVEVVAGSEVEDAFVSGIAEQGTAFARAVRGDSAPYPDAYASARALAVGLAVQRAATEQREVAVG